MDLIVTQKVKKKKILVFKDDNPKHLCDIVFNKHITTSLKIEYITIKLHYDYYSRPHVTFRDVIPDNAIINL